MSIRDTWYLVRYNILELEDKVIRGNYYYGEYIGPNIKKWSNIQVFIYTIGPTNYGPP